MGTKQSKKVTVKADENVVKAPDTTFEERTSARAPWLKEDGTQDNGDVIVSEPVIEE